MLRLAGASIACAAMVAVGGFAAKADSFYDGKTLTLVVPYSPGGGTDAWARTVVPFLQKHIGKDAAIQIVNSPGAGGVNGSNEFFLRTEPDGNTVLMSSGSAVMPWLLGMQAVRYDYRKMIPVVGQPVGNVLYTTPDIGSDPKGLLNPPKELVSAGLSATGADLAQILAFEVLDIPVKHVLGYSSGGAVQLAFEQGEATIGHTSAPAYKTKVQPIVDEGKAVPLFTFGVVDKTGQIVRDTEFPDIATVRDVYVDLKGSEPSGTAWDAYKAVTAAAWGLQKIVWYHADAPAEARQSFVEGFQKALQDPEFRSAVKERIGAYEFLTGEDLRVAFKETTDISPETLEWIRNLLREGYGVTQF